MSGGGREHIKLHKASVLCKALKVGVKVFITQNE